MPCFLLQRNLATSVQLFSRRLHTDDLQATSCPTHQSCILCFERSDVEFMSLIFKHLSHLELSASGIFRNSTQASDQTGPSNLRLSASCRPPMLQRIKCNHQPLNTEHSWNSSSSRDVAVVNNRSMFLNLLHYQCGTYSSFQSKNRGQHSVPRIPWLLHSFDRKVRIRRSAGGVVLPTRASQSHLSMEAFPCSRVFDGTSLLWWRRRGRVWICCASHSKIEGSRDRHESITIRAYRIERELFSRR